MLTNLFIWLGWSRDDLKWFWIQLVAGLVAGAGLIADNLINVQYWVTYLGLPIGERGIHWVIFLAGAITWIAARSKRSALPSGAAMASGVVAGSPASKVSAILLACVLAGAVSFSTPGCAATRPPAGTFSSAGLKAFDADQLLKDITALSQTAVNLNATQGQLHLKDRDTAFVRDFALSAGAGLVAYGKGQGTLDVVVAAFDELSRKLSAEAALNDKLRFVLALVADNIHRIPGQ